MAQWYFIACRHFLCFSLLNFGRFLVAMLGIARFAIGDSVPPAGREAYRTCMVPTLSNQEHSGTPNHWYFLKSIAGTNGRHTAVQIGRVVQYKLEVYCSISLSLRLRSQEGTALQMGGVLRYKLEVYYSTFRQVVRVVGS